MSSARSSRHPSRVAESLLWLTAATGGALALVTWRAVPVHPSVAGVTGAPTTPVAERRDPPDQVLAAAATLADHDPFRLSHHPAQLAFGAPTPAALPVPSGPPVMALAPRPHLALLGIVGGPGRWEAVLTGAAGREGGALVRAGDTLGGLRVRRVTADSLVVQGRDTVWRLALAGTGPGGLPGVGARP